MNTPALDCLDRCIAEFDAALRTMLAPAASAGRPSPAADTVEAALSPSDRDLAGRLMRVNHAGEIAAQALYRGQALAARDPTLRVDLLRAAGEEHDHLAWCAERASELGKSISLLTPIWYFGSLAIGTAAGIAGDRISLGFLAETENQVTEHLDGHLQRLPEADQRSRRIVERMRSEEMAHRRSAIEQGGTDLPPPLPLCMRLAARVMTTVAYLI